MVGKPLLAFSETRIEIWSLLAVATIASTGPTSALERDTLTDLLGQYSPNDCLLHELGPGEHFPVTFTSLSWNNIPVLRTHKWIATKEVRCYILLANSAVFASNLAAIQALRVTKKLVLVHSNSSEQHNALRKGIHNFDIVLITANRRGSHDAFWKLKNAQHIMHLSGNRLVPHNDSWMPNRIRVGHVNFPPFNVVGNGSVSGLDIDIWKIIAIKLGAKPVFVQAPNIGSLPSLVRNGALDVAGFELLYHEAWLPGNSLSPSTYFRKFLLAARYPKPVEKYLTLLEPFSMNVWLSVASSIAIMCLVLGTSQRLGSRNGFDTFGLFSIATGIMVNEALPSRLLQLKPGNKAVNILIVAWIPSVCLLCWAYQSNLLSCLIKSRMTKPIDTFQDILDNGLKVYISKGNILESVVKSHPLPIMHDIREKHVELYDFDEKGEVSDELWSDIFKGTAVMDVTEKRLYGHSHELRIGRELILGSFPAGFYYGLGSPFQTECDKILLAILESGVFLRLDEKNAWLLTKDEREFFRQDVTREVVVIGQSHTLPIWLLFIAFALLALITFMIEIIS